jgi:hypothetical protein
VAGIFFFRDRRGGFLSEALLAFLLVALGAAAWLAVSGRGGMPLGIPGRWFGGEKGPSSSTPSADPQKDSAWLHQQVRETLLRHGLGEAHVLKSYNRERRREGKKWVENVMEIKTHAGFDVSSFRRDVEKAIRDKKLAVVRESRERGRHVLEFGDSNRVFGRLVFHATAS